MAIKRVEKRDGHTEAYKTHKLERSIKHALQHANSFDPDRAYAIALEVTEYLKSQNKQTIPAHEIHTAVMHILDLDEPAIFSHTYSLAPMKNKATPLSMVIKRNGSTEPFQPEKIFKTIKRAFAPNHIPSGKQAELLMHKTIQQLEQADQQTTLRTETIQATICEILMKHGLFDIERSYRSYKYL